MNNRFPIYLLFLMLTSLPGRGQQQLYFFKNYNVNSGLSDNIVRCIVRDPEGFLWSGTTSGLNRFDSHEFRVYRSLANDTTTLSSNIINNLMIDHTGKLWVATFGVCIYLKEKNEFRRIPLMLPGKESNYDYETFVLFQDHKNQIWAGTNGFGLLKYDKDRECFEPVKLQITDKNSTSESAPKAITSIIRHSDGSMWLCNYTRLYRFSPESNQVTEFNFQITTETRIPENFQGLKLFPDKNNSNIIWIATWGHGLVSFDISKQQFHTYRFESGKPINLSNIVQDIFFKSDHLFWLATNNGVIEFDIITGKFSEPLSDQLNNNPVVNTNINDLYLDKDSIIWIGTHHGLSNINPSLQNFVSNKILPDNYPHLLDDGNDKYYVTRFYRDRSLIIYDNANKTVQKIGLPEANELRAEPFHILKDSDGLIWIGTTKGLYTYDENRERIRIYDLKNDPGIDHRNFHVMGMTSDQDGNLWIICRDQLLIRKKGSGVFIRINNIANQNRINPFSSMLLITKGLNRNIIIYSLTAGIFTLNIDDFIPKIILPADLKSNLKLSVTSIKTGPNQSIWVCTQNNGLLHINKNGKVTEFMRDANGRIISEQQHLVIDKRGRPWFKSNNIIYMFNPDDSLFTGYNIEDGLPEIHEGTSLNKLHNGDIAFNINKGVFSFSPEKVIRPQLPLSVHLTNATINGKQSALDLLIDRTDTLKLLHTENNISFDFAAINYSSPSTTWYTYKLDGSDAGWSEPTNTRMLSFNQLHPGTYTLRIKAGSPVIPKSAQEKTLVIQIIPAWYQTIAFKVISGIIILVITVLLIRFIIALRFREKLVQLEHQREIEQIRARISRDIHDEIGAGLTKIKLMSRGLTRKIGKSQELIESTVKIADTSDELIRNLGEIVWTINPENDSLENIVAFIRIYLSRIFETNPDITLTGDLPDHDQIPANVWVNPEVKRNLLLILKESLTNIFKHSTATGVKVILRVSAKAILLEVHDDGIGLSQGEESAFGNGIRNMRKRASAINATFSLKNNGISGTILLLDIPLIQKL